MNCCDAYGNCNQGRDCPVRQACELPEVDHATDYLLPEVDHATDYLLPITCVVLGIALGGASVLLYLATTIHI
jgi:hypothetical protein